MRKIVVSILGLTLISALVIGLYIYFNFQRDAETQKVDQSGLNDSAVIESIKTLSDQSSKPGESNLAQQSAITKIRSGNFTKFDPAHYASGQAVIYETIDGPILKLENFETNNGPDLFVYLATNANIEGIKTNRGDEVSLGELKQIKGDQVYKLPEDYQQYNSVVIWCRAFDINFSAAQLLSI